MAASNPALILQWAIAVDAQRTRGATADMYIMARHFGLERVNYHSVPRFLAHMRTCKGMSKATRECASDIFDFLVSKNQYTYAYTCEHCTAPVPWDMTVALGPLDQLYTRFNVDINSRMRVPKRYREEDTDYEDEAKRELKRSRSEEADEILVDSECTVALLADVIKVY